MSAAEEAGGFMATSVTAHPTGGRRSHAPGKGRFQRVITGRGFGEVEVSRRETGITVFAWDSAETAVTNRAGERLAT